MSDPQAPQPRAPRSVLQIIVATIGIIIMLFAGSCVLLFLGTSARFDPEGILSVVAGIGGVPFLVGLLITWLALRRK